MHLLRLYSGMDLISCTGATAEEMKAIRKELPLMN